jgi:hypothetical protein
MDKKQKHALLMPSAVVGFTDKKTRGPAEFEMQYRSDNTSEEENSTILFVVCSRLVVAFGIMVGAPAAPASLAPVPNSFLNSCHPTCIQYLSFKPSWSVCDPNAAIITAKTLSITPFVNKRSSEGCGLIDPPHLSSSAGLNRQGYQLLS